MPASDNKQDQTTTGTRLRNSSPQENRLPLKIVFVHLDLGIGGAEQLVLQLAQASVAAKHDIEIWTTRCDPSHAFDAVKPGGSLHSFLRVKGSYLPHSLFGNKARALCSTIRLLFLVYRLVRSPHYPDLVVLDVLSTPLPLLRWSSIPSLFYCHYPDQLLVQGKVSGKKSLYRRFMDSLETWTMHSSDLCVVNSLFTKKIVEQTFGMQDLKVLYPTLDEDSLGEYHEPGVDHEPISQRPIVSLNRFERKKNLSLLLDAVEYVRNRGNVKPDQMPPVILAGGYDPKNRENVEHYQELKSRAEKLGVQLEHSISDQRRARLLRDALCVVYTPSNEHFGIVPLEAMYSGTPVLAVNSGGPLETVVDGKTGALREATAQSFGNVLEQWILHPETAANLGMAAASHVKQKFGKERLRVQWNDLCYLASEKGCQKQLAVPRRQFRTFVYAFEAIATLLLCFVVAFVFREIRLNVLHIMLLKRIDESQEL